LSVYAVLKKNANPEQLDAPLASLVQKYKDVSQRVAYGVMPLKDVYVYGKSRFGRGAGQKSGDIRYVWLFSAVAVLILTIACMNYVNIAIARSTRRTQEAGIRKVVGAARYQLIIQFMGEAMLFAFIATMIAIPLCELSLSWFGAMVDRDIDLNYLIIPGFWLTLVIVVFVVGLLAGSYPGIYLSRFNPAGVLQNQQRTGALNRLRKGLVISQFVISIAFILGASIINNQLSLVQNSNLGFDSDQVLVVDTKGAIHKRHRAFKNALRENPHIKAVTATSSIPGKGTFIGSLDTRNIESYSGAHDYLVYHQFYADQDFAKVLGLEILEGRLLNDSLSMDKDAAVLLNEAAVKKMGWKEAVGKYIGEPGKRTHVVGVVKDFHFDSFKSRIEPAFFKLSASRSNYIAIKLQTHDLQTTIKFINKTWHEFVPSRPLVYFFVDDTFAAMYRTEERLGQLMGAAAALAISISIFGLFGLAAFAAEQRTKEIGIRKVLGASVGSLVSLLSKDFIKLVLLANIFAWPLAWYAMDTWLQNFAYHVEIGWWVFVLAGGLALVIALLTVSTQAIRAALANPVESLKYE